MTTTCIFAKTAALPFTTKTTTTGRIWTQQKLYPIWIITMTDTKTMTEIPKGRLAAKRGRKRNAKA